MKNFNARQHGFTLIEMAIVLVVIGLILGMVYKGRQLIDSAKVKNVNAQYLKITAAINTFYDRYGFYPGDGCTSPTESIMNCLNNGDQNGLIDGNGNSNEGRAFWNQLIEQSGILTQNDRESVFGQPWDTWTPPTNGGNTGEIANKTWLDFIGTPQLDVRIFCALDQKADDGEPQSGQIQTRNNPYNPDSDCWSLSGQVDGWLQILP